MGKNYNAAASKLEAERAYGLDEGLKLVPGTKCAKFDETVEVSGRLGVNPKHPDQMVRGTLVLPNGTGKSVRVLVFARRPRRRRPGLIMSGPRSSLRR
jgi:large subunit ribosomal protein L1